MYDFARGETIRHIFKIEKWLYSYMLKCDRQILIPTHLSLIKFERNHVYLQAMTRITMDECLVISVHINDGPFSYIPSWRTLISMQKLYALHQTILFHGELDYFTTTMVQH